MNTHNSSVKDMHIQEYLDLKILEFKEKLSTIQQLRDMENAKPFAERNYKGMFLLYKDETLYNFCLQEFKLLKEMS
jgi:hypothetical protein